MPAPRLNAPYASYLASYPFMHAKVYHLYKSSSHNDFCSHSYLTLTLSSHFLFCKLQSFRAQPGYQEN